MNGRESVPQRKDGPPQSALITPSASPPVTRPLSWLSSRISLDRPPPAKRRRLGSTPSSPFSHSTPSSSSVDPLDIHEIRKASSQRLLNTWASLAERYNRPLDEDDIIDLRDGSIVKDRGFLRNAAKKFEFAGSDALSDVNDASSDFGGLQTDDDVDELDAFAPGADISGELELEREKLLVPPVQERDPADAEDLREFLEAERLRKEQYGDEEDEEEVVNLMTTGGSLSSRCASPHGESPNRSERSCQDHNEAQDVGGREDGKDDIDDMPHRSAPSSVGPSHGDDSSDDEFATWDFDTTTPVKPAKQQRVSTPDDIIDLTESPPSSPSLVISSRGRSRDPVRMLGSSRQAPRAKSMPRGRSKTPARGKEDASQAGTKAKSSARSNTPARRKMSMPPPPLPSAIVSQLITPPPSSSSVIDSTPETMAGLTARSPSPSPPPSPPLFPRPKPRLSQQGPLLATRRSTDQSPRTGSGSGTTAAVVNSKTTKAPRLRLVPEVVIDRAHMGAASLRASSPQSSLDTRILDQTNTEQPLKCHGHSQKGTTKATGGSVDRSRVVPRNTTHKGLQTAPKQGSSKGKAVTKANASVADQGDSADEIPLQAKMRKRKRVLSSSSLSGTSDKDEPFPTMTPIVPPRTHTQVAPKDTPGPSSSSRTPKSTRRDTVIDNDDSDDAGPEPPPPPPPPRARTPYKPLPPQTKEDHSSQTPRTPQRHDNQIPYPPDVVQDPDAQMRFVQAAHYLSYIMSAAASLPPPTGYPPGYPPLPFPIQTPHWPPWTPAHRTRRSRQDWRSDVSSEDAGPSGSSLYNTPSHSHPYPLSFDPTYSSASLPPSSPPASSESSSPIARSSSLARGRSKSRGRRVSFKLDGDDRPIRPSPPRFDHDEAAAGGSDKVQARGSDTSGQAVRKANSRVSGRAATPAVRSDKGKARAERVDDSDGSDSGRGRRRERGRTPGPPAHSERSASTRAAGRKG